MSWAADWPRDDPFLVGIFSNRATCREGTASAGADGTRRRRWWGRLPKSVDVRTLEMERRLKEECLARGVTFVLKAVGKPADVMDLHPGCSLFVAADGAHSRMRTALWGKDHLRRRNIYPSLDFNYVSAGQPSYLKVNTYETMGHVYAENVGLMEGGISAVNIRMIVSEEQYDAIPRATVRDPLKVEPDSRFWSAMGPDPFFGRTPKQDFYELLRLRAAHARERRTDGPVTMTKIHLSQYDARSFARVVTHDGSDRSWFLVGDSAAGMPFYRAVNSGMLLGSRLAWVLCRDGWGGAMKVRIYDTCIRPMRVTRERIRIARRELLIKTVKDVARPALLALMRSPLGPWMRKPVERVVTYAKYGRFQASSAAR